MRRRILLLTIASSSAGGVNTRVQAMSSYLSRFYVVHTLRIRFPSLVDAARTPFLAFAASFQFINCLRSYDVVISFSNLPNLIASLFAKRSILSVTGSCYHSLDTTILSRFYWSCLLQPLSFVLSDAIVPASPAVLPCYAGFLPFFRTRVCSINGFVDHERIDLSVSSSLGSDALDFPYILFLGALTNQKGILELLSVFSLLRKSCPTSPLKLFVCGDGPLLGALISKCQSESLSLSFFDNQTLPQSDVIVDTNPACPYSLISNSCIVACPFYYEGLSNTILESLYLGKPVLASSNPSSQFIRQSLLSLIGKDSLSPSLIRLLPHPSINNYQVWSDELLKAHSSENVCDAPALDAFNLTFSASSNVSKWAGLIEALL